ncbi:MAG: type II and III secretion system protein family protein [Micavibrio aeruginosavorus]|nr:type II and III secretion system protein family protein [Micavibrio aeruginosavorus]
MKRLCNRLFSFRRIAAFAVLVAGLTFVPVLCAYADKADLVSVDAAKVRGGNLVGVTLGKGEVVEIKGDVADILVANPAVADVVALQSNKLYVVGSQLGDTNLIALDSEGNVIERLDIHVMIDEAAIQKYLNELYPDEHVIVKALNDQVILTGTVSNPAISNRISQVVSAYIGEIQDMEGSTDEIIVNLLNVSGEQQVMLRVKILEVSKSLIKELGIESELNREQGNFIGALGISTSGVGITQPAFGLGTLIFDDGGSVGPISAILSALEQGEMVQTLAEPNLTAISGQEAGFLAGGEFPVPAGRDSDGNVLIEFRPFGVSLNFRPTVMSENRISLQLNTEVSSVSRDETVTLEGLEVPGRNIRRASTTIEVPSGGGMMIGGLLQSNTVKGMAGLPGVNDVPVLGDLISSRSFNRDETELVVLVTAYLVSPYAEKENKKQDDNIPAGQAVPLANAFADNIRRIYGRKASGLLDDGSRYGYLIN